MHLLLLPWCILSYTHWRIRVVVVTFERMIKPLGLGSRWLEDGDGIRCGSEHGPHGMNMHLQPHGTFPDVPVNNGSDDDSYN